MIQTTAACGMFAIQFPWQEIPAIYALRKSMVNTKNKIRNSYELERVTKKSRVQTSGPSRLPSIR